MEHPFLDLQQVSKSFGSFTALKSIDLQIAAGELVCFLGPSGCGKTTLLRIIAGLESQTSGRIFQSQRDISHEPPAQRDYGIVFQSYALFPNLTVAANVAYGLVNRKAQREAMAQRVTELLTLVGLPGSEGKYPAQLSGGQQQRIALARALATSPGLLLLDEPLSALDAVVRVRLRQEIRELQKRLGVTTILVTHDQEEALSMADRIVVMNHGVIEQVGTPLEVYREPATAFVADFVGAVNVLPARVLGGQLHLGQLAMAHAGADREAQAYVRPEDVVLAFGETLAFDATVEKIEFLGAYCHVQVRSPALPETLRMSVAMHELAQRSVAVGSALRLQLLSERVQVF